MEALIFSYFQRRGTENIVHQYPQICVGIDCFLQDLCAIVITSGISEVEISGTSYTIHAGSSIAGDHFFFWTKIQYWVWFFVYLILHLSAYSRSFNLPLSSVAISSHCVTVLWYYVIAFLNFTLFNQLTFRNLYQSVFFHCFVMSSCREHKHVCLPVLVRSLQDRRSVSKSYPTDTSYVI